MKIYFKDNLGYVVVGKTKERQIYQDSIGAYYLKRNKESVYLKENLISKARAISQFPQKKIKNRKNDSKRIKHRTVSRIKTQSLLQ